MNEDFWMTMPSVESTTAETTWGTSTRSSSIHGRSFGSVGLVTPNLYQKALPNGPPKSTDTDPLIPQPESASHPPAVPPGLGCEPLSKWRNRVAGEIRRRYGAVHAGNRGAFRELRPPA